MRSQTSALSPPPYEAFAPPPAYVSSNEPPPSPLDTPSAPPPEYSNSELPSAPPECKLEPEPSAPPETARFCARNTSAAYSNAAPSGNDVSGSEGAVCFEGEIAQGIEAIARLHEMDDKEGAKEMERMVEQLKAMALAEEHPGAASEAGQPEGARGDAAVAACMMRMQAVNCVCSLMQIDMG